jgi:hypothetical protein
MCRHASSERNASIKGRLPARPPAMWMKITFGADRLALETAPTLSDAIATL